MVSLRCKVDCRLWEISFRVAFSIISVLVWFHTGQRHAGSFPHDHFRLRLLCRFTFSSLDEHFGMDEHWRHNHDYLCVVTCFPSRVRRMCNLVRCRNQHSDRSCYIYQLEACIRRACTACHAAFCERPLSLASCPFLFMFFS